MDGSEKKITNMVEAAAAKVVTAKSEGEWHPVTAASYNGLPNCLFFAADISIPYWPDPLPEQL